MTDESKVAGKDPGAASTAAPQSRTWRAFTWLLWCNELEGLDTARRIFHRIKHDAALVRDKPRGAGRRSEARRSCLMAAW